MKQNHKNKKNDKKNEIMRSKIDGTAQCNITTLYHHKIVKSINENYLITKKASYRKFYKFYNEFNMG